MRLLRLPYTYLHFLALPLVPSRHWESGWQRTIPSSLATEVWRFKWFMLSAPCSVLTNRKFPQSFHHRKFPVRKFLTAQTKSSSATPLLTPCCPQTAQAAEAVRAEGGGCEQGWKVAGGWGVSSMGRNRGEQRSHFTSPGLGFVRELLTNCYRLVFTSWPVASPQAKVNLEREDLMWVQALRGDLHLWPKSFSPLCTTLGIALSKWDRY